MQATVKRCCAALKQFIALALGHLGQHHSLRDIEAALASDPKLHYHLGTRAVGTSALARAAAGVHDIRRIEYRDPDSDKLYGFITNHKRWAVQTIADI